MLNLIRFAFYVSFPIVVIFLVIPMDYYPRSIMRAFYELKWLDEAAHAFIFMMLGIGMAVYGMKPLRVFLSLTLFAALTEVLQSFSGRFPSLMDLAWDLVGIALAYIIVITFKLYNKKVEKTED